MARAKPRRRRFLDEDRAAALAALAANGGNVKLTAAQLGIAQTTLRQWAKGTRHPEAAQLSDGKRGELADRLEAIAWQLADALPGKLAGTGLQATATTLGIVVDKMQLLRNRPTAINRAENSADDDLRGLTDEELARRLDEARGRAGAPAEAGPGAGPPGGGPADAGAGPAGGGEGPPPPD